MRRYDLRRVLGFAAAATGIGAVLAIVVVWFAAGHLPGDAFTYTAAGERLNAGHEVYRLLPGDSPVLMEPPYPPYPILSPPLIAVVFRPLALVPAGLGPWLWWAAMLVCLAVAVALLVRRAPMATGLGLLVLCFPVAVVVGVGNVDAFVLLGVVLTWILIQRGLDLPAGALLGLLASLKVTPLIFAWWLLIHGERRAAMAFGVAVAVLAALTVLGSYPRVFGEYLDVVRATVNVVPGALSLAGLGRAIGLPPDMAAALGRIALVAAGVAMLALRRHPAAGYSIAGLMLWLGSPAAAAHTPALGLAALAPLAARIGEGARGRAGEERQPVASTIRAEPTGQ